MSGEMKPSRDYSTMTREEAVRHFGQRQVELQERILSLTTAEKFRLVGDFLDAVGEVDPLVAINVARLALAELEGRR